MAVITWVKSHGIILIVLGIFIASMVFINPIRETPIDDDWAYALTVKSLIDTGKYVLHPWAAANFPFQAVWGGLFSWALGYSFSALRISTLVLTVAGLLTMYLFSRDLKISRKMSGLLVLILLACPLFLKFTFSFMTDIPFLSLLVLSAFLYSRAFSKKSSSYALLAGITCAAAILTRQLGIALLGAVFVYGAIYYRKNASRPLMILGLALPVLAAIWQLQAAFIAPNWGMMMITQAQKLYFSDPGGFLTSLFMRPAYILIYLSLFCLPLIPTIFVQFHHKFPVRVWLLVFGYLFLSLLSGKLSRWNLPLTFPYIPWGFSDIIPENPIIVRAAITAFILLWAITFGTFLVQSLKKIRKDFEVGNNIAFITIIFSCLLFYTLVYYKLGDEYLLIFAPFLLLSQGRLFKDQLKSTLVFAATLLIAIFAIAISATLVRNNLVRWEAYWQSCESLRLRAIPVGDISCEWKWVSYYSYQEYIDQTKEVKHSDLNDFFKRWLPEREIKTQYIATESQYKFLGEMRIIDVKSYKIFPFGRGVIYIMKKNESN